MLSFPCVCDLDHSCKFMDGASAGPWRYQALTLKRLRERNCQHAVGAVHFTQSIYMECDVSAEWWHCFAAITDFSPHHIWWRLESVTLWLVFYLTVSKRNTYHREKVGKASQSLKNVLFCVEKHRTFQSALYLISARCFLHGGANEWQGWDYKKVERKVQDRG